VATIVVSTTGNDSTGTGSLVNPYLTHEKADSLIGPGDSVLVQPGTYNRNTKISTVANGTPSSRISWKANGAYGSVHIVSTVNNAEGWLAQGNYCDHIGFDITGSLLRVGLSNFGHHNRFFNNIAHDCGTALAIGSPGAGFFSYAGVTTLGTNEWAYNEAIRCGQSGVGSFEYHGFYLATTGEYAHDNKVSNSAGWGFNISGSGFNAGNSMLIAHNLSHYNTYGGFKCQLSADRNTFANNITYNNNVLGSGVLGNGFIEGSGANLPGPNNVYTNNCSFAQGNVDYATMVGTVLNPINADPLFVNYKSDGTGDYHLKPGSPAIDAGSIAYVSSTDFEGRFRVSAHPTVGPHVYKSHAFGRFLAH
jgi:hypothetical protein